MYKTLTDGTSVLHGRRLRVMKLLFEPGREEYDDQNEMILLAQAVMGDDPTLTGILIFGYSSAFQAKHGSFDKGRVVATRDGRGWTGNGFVLDGATKDQLGIMWFQRNVITKPNPIYLPLDEKVRTEEDFWGRVSEYLREKPKPGLEHLSTPYQEGKIFLPESPKVCLYCHQPGDFHTQNCPFFQHSEPPWTRPCPVCAGGGSLVGPPCSRCKGTGRLTLCPICMEPVDEHKRPC